MFTGIIEELGEVVEVRKNRGGIKLRIQAGEVLNGTKAGDSINVDGVCLTVCEVREKNFLVDVIKETLMKTTLSELHSASKVNLERAVQLNGRFGGHFVTGHVDGVGKIVKKSSGLITIQVPAGMVRYIFPRASIAVDGVSFTVVSSSHNRFEIAIIPHTARMTTLGFKNKGSLVNLEADFLGKQVENLLQHREGITKEFLSERGFIKGGP